MPSILPELQGSQIAEIEGVDAENCHRKTPIRDIFTQPMAAKAQDQLNAVAVLALGPGLQHDRLVTLIPV